MAHKQPDIYDAIAEPTRRAILTLLGGRTMSAGEIATRFPQRRPAISKHLTILKRAGLIRESRDRQRRLYSLRSSELGMVAGFVEGLIRTASSTDDPQTAGPARIRSAAEPPCRQVSEFDLEFD